MREQMKALQDIRSWAAKGEARDIGARAGMELPEDPDFVAHAEETPGVEPEHPREEMPAAEGADSLTPEQIEELLQALTAGA
jgi:hypothetical protein